MQTISIRLDDETITKIEALRGSEHKSSFFRKLIEHGLHALEHKDLQSDDKEITPDDRVITNDYTILKARNESLEELLKAKEQTIRTLENQNGFLMSEFQRMSSINERLLMPSHEEIKAKGRHFWEFWKQKKDK